MSRAGTDTRGALVTRPDAPRVARGGLLNLVGAAVSAVTGVLVVVVVTRTLPQAEAGVFFALTSVFLLAQTTARLGTGTGLVYWVARVRSLGAPERIRALQRVAVLPVVAVSLLTAGALVLASSTIARLVGGAPEATRLAVVVLALLLPVTALSDTFLSTTRGHALMLPTVVLDRVGRPLLQLGLVAVAVTTGSLTLLAGAWAVPWAGSALLAWWWVTRLSRSLPRSADARADGRTWRQFWAFTAPRGVNSLVQLALQRLDIILVAVLIGPAQAAVYTAATRFLVVGQLTSTAISTAAQPRLSELLAVENRAAANALYRTATAWVVLLTWPLYLLCAVFADVVLGVFGSGYAAGGPVVLVLAGAMLVATACGMVDTVLNMAGRTSWTLANSVVALTVLVVVDLLLIPRLGILGAAIGWAAAILVNNLLPLTQLVRHLGLHPFGRGTLTAVVLSAACFGLVPAVTAVLVPDDRTAVAVAAAAGTLTFLVGCAHWRDVLALPALRALGRSRRPGLRRTDTGPTTPGGTP